MTEEPAAIPAPEGLTDAVGDEAVNVVNRVAGDLLAHANQAIADEIGDRPVAHAWLMIGVVTNMTGNVAASLALGGSPEDARRLLHRNMTKAIDRAWRAGETTRAGGTQ